MTRKNQRSSEPEILVGWKAIAAAYGGCSERTMQRKAAKHRLPVKYIDGRPQITHGRLLDWWEGLPDQRRALDLVVGQRGGE